MYNVSPNNHSVEWLQAWSAFQSRHPRIHTLYCVTRVLEPVQITYILDWALSTCYSTKWQQDATCDVYYNQRRYGSVAWDYVPLNNHLYNVVTHLNVDTAFLQPIWGQLHMRSKQYWVIYLLISGGIIASVVYWSWSWNDTQEILRRYILFVRRQRLLIRSVLWIRVCLIHIIYCVDTSTVTCILITDTQLKPYL